LTFKRLFYLVIFSACFFGFGRQASAQQSVIQGPGCTTAYHIDWDCDGYGVGTDPHDPNPLLGPDADDSDPSVNTPASMLAKWGTVSAFLAHLGYNPNNIWYLSTAGNDATCAANNPALPCQTWSRAYSASSPGDAILVRGGTFTSNANYSIGRAGTSAAHPDILMSYPGELGVLDHASGDWYGISSDLGTVNYTIIDGLKVQNTPLSSPNNMIGGMGIDLNSAGPIYGDIIRNCEVRDYYRGIWIIAGHNGTLIERNSIHDDYGVGGGEHNIYLGSNNGTGNSTNLTVQNNLLYNAAWDNFHYNGVCTSCVLSGNIMFSANLTAGGGSGNVALQEGWNHSTIQNNIIFNSSASAVQIYDYDDGQAPLILPYNQNYNVFRNNTIVHTGQDWIGQNITGYTPFSIVNGSQCPNLTPATNCASASYLDLGHNTYDNNIFVEMASSVQSNAAVMRYGYNSSSDLNWLSTDTWRNNVLYAANGAPPLAIGVGITPPTQDWAYFAANALVFTNNSQANPVLLGANDAWFNAPQSWNLQVAAGSPAIGAALASDAPATDIMGKSRGSAPDIGAYQYGDSSTSIALTINTAVLNSGTAGTAYTQGLSASGGTMPYSWLVTSGSLPVGLALSSAGVISGTPVVAGTSSITVEVQDSAGHSASATWSITIAPVAAAPVASLSSLSCNPGSLPSSGSATCTATLSGPAASGGTAVALVSNNTLLSVPSSVTVAAGATSAGFTATAGSISVNSTATITATLASDPTTASISLTAPAGTTGPSPSAGTLSIQGTPSEVSGTANGAVLTPTVAPTGLTGLVTVRGTGSLNFGSNGVAFGMGGQQNGNTAFYTITGSQIQNIFNVSQGQISFNLTSSYNLAARQALPQYSYRDVFDGFDNSQELYLFQVQAEYGRLIFGYNTGGTTVQSYYVPAGTEDTLFGQGVTVQVKLTWSGSSQSLYLNGTLVSTASYTPATPNWTSTSSFTLGASDPHSYGGGYFSSDDTVGAFQAQNTASSGAPAAPAATVTSVLCSASSLASSGSTTCTATLSAAAPASGTSVALASNNALLTVPSSVTVAAGATSAGFTATAGTIATNQSASVTATLSGSSQSASLALTAPAAPAATVTSLRCGAGSLASSGSTTCTVTLSAVGASAATVALASNNALLTVPSSVTVAVGGTQAAFTAAAGTIATNQSASVTATLNGSSQSASFTLTAPAAPAATVTSLLCSPGSLASSGSTTCTATLSAAAPSGGSTAALASNNALLSVPSSVTVAAGATSAGFTATAGTIASNQSATVTATLNGSSQSASIALTAPAVTMSSLLCGASSLASNASTTCTATLSAPAPSGGASVALASNNTLLNMPSAVTVAAGATSAGFTATAGKIASNQSATVTATLSGSSQSASIALTAPVITVSTLKCAASSLASSGSTTCTVTLSAAAPTGGSTVALASTLTVPSSVKVAAGATSACFTAKAGKIVTNQGASVTATLNGSSQSTSIMLTASPARRGLALATAY
jgi:hypothetical protein